jgi:hypothetical protein
MKLKFLMYILKKTITMIELPTDKGTIYCELITIQDTPFIFFSTLEDVQRAITCVYPVRYYSIETALNQFINYTKQTYESRKK